jgi:hypothetical protein
MFKLIREEEREKKMTVSLEKQCSEKEKKEQEDKNLCEEEHEKNREWARHAREEVESKKMRPNGRENTLVGLTRFIC